MGVCMGVCTLYYIHTPTAPNYYTYTHTHTHNRPSYATVQNPQQSELAALFGSFVLV